MTYADNDQVKKEYNRLAKLYKDIPENKRELVDGLLDQAARMRVSLNLCWQDIAEHGRTELRTRTNGEETEVERDVSKIFTATDRSYQTIIKQLNELLPTVSGTSKLDSFIGGDN